MSPLEEHSGVMSSPEDTMPDVPWLDGEAQRLDAEALGGIPEELEAADGEALGHDAWAGFPEIVLRHGNLCTADATSLRR